ncbi:protein of unknown function DUF262 [Gloeothece citriformis PCC 7424]|uniref:GmrSD restriction endonucleases N-terminal domain-containing protein n=1 Tax=Gloeothece citriformis (strain PCC 7424) TaxID=65393 RepID=B7KIV7_GLOC7|nr:DUF262 domain-containing protein [Gloeothece citriformis]ACK70793.1 protein of unknown function DUF262 [Gloeothece citriformis PCC 7424]
MTQADILDLDSYDEASNLDEEIDGQELPNKLIYDPEKINIITREPTIEQLLRRINEQALDLAPDFQRHANIWKDDAKSRLVESIIIRIPIPAFYIDATNEDRWLVIDGLQRLFALKQFVNDKTLKLSGLEYLSHLEGKTYNEIERRYQRRIQETQVTVYLVEKGTPPEVKYNIFKRINTGGEPMSPQELRHALNPGKVTHFLTKLASSTEFKKVVPLSNSRIMRMDDREFVLGFLAFYLTKYTEFKDGKRDAFFDEAMSKINQISNQELTIIEKIFKETMNLAWNIFGENAFRKLSRKQKKRYPVNKALFEAWSVNLSQLDENEKKLLESQSSQKNLLNMFMDFVDNDLEFLISISQASEKVEYRFTIIEKIIRNVIS